MFNPDANPKPLIASRYELRTVIGEGGSSSVFCARDVVLERDVALKVFRADQLDATESKRQLSELHVLTSLNHHSLVTLLDTGVATDRDGMARRFLVMEMVNGPDLQQRIKDGPIHPRHLGEIAYDVAEALQYIHARGIVHRDIKPSNILLADYGDNSSRARAKLTDFGIALGSPNPQVTDEGVTTGTAAYLSPEQANGDDIGPASDVYSLGLVLLEGFTRQLAFPGTPVQSAIARLQRDPEVPAHLPEHWRVLLTAMLARDPALRPSTASDLVPLLRSNVIADSSRHSDDDTPVDPDEEAMRMRAVRHLGILDSAPDQAFDRITSLAAHLLKTPISLISIVDTDRIWFASHHGIEIESIGRDPGLCASAILQRDIWVIEDARVDARALSNPLVAGPLGLQFYAGVPLVTADNEAVGTLCVADYEPRKLDPADALALENLAALTMQALEQRRSNLV